MKQEQQPKPQKRKHLQIGGTIFASLLILGGCESSPAPIPTFDYCSFVKTFDSDCDGVINSEDKYPGLNDMKIDSDNDGIPDFLDLYPHGFDYGDLDGDGIKNAYDLTPTIPTYIGGTSSQTQDAYRDQERQKYLNNTKNLQEEVLDNYVILNQMNIQERDNDYDGIPDAEDNEPTLNNYDDQDGDGYSNGRDIFPYDPSDY